MKIKDGMEQKIKKMDGLDMALVKGSSVLFGILLVMWMPGLIKININLLVALIFVLAFRPMYRYFLK